MDSFYFLYYSTTILLVYELFENKIKTKQAEFNLPLQLKPFYVSNIIRMYITGTVYSGDLNINK